MCADRGTDDRLSPCQGLLREAAAVAGGDFILEFGVISATLCTLQTPPRHKADAVWSSF